MAAVVRSALVRAARTTRRMGVSLARSMSSKSDKAEMTNADITKAFLEMDAAVTAAPASASPLKLTGRSGALAEQLYTAAKGNAKAFDKYVKELEAFVGVVSEAGLVVDRFFATANYSDVELKLVADLLLTSKEPLSSFDGIKSADVRELIVDNEGNLDAWRNARKAVAALNLSPEVKSVIDALAGAARLDLVRAVAAKAGELRAFTSKVVDAVVASAVPLSKEQQAAVAKALPAYAPAGNTLNVTFAVEPAVMGGLLITMKNQTIDLSVSSRLVDVVTAARSQQLA